MVLELWSEIGTSSDVVLVGIVEEGIGKNTVLLEMVLLLSLGSDVLMISLAVQLGVMGIVWFSTNLAHFISSTV